MIATKTTAAKLITAASVLGLGEKVVFQPCLGTNVRMTR